MRKVNVLNLSPLTVSYKPQAGQRKIPVAASRMAGGQVHIPTLLFQRP
jgi:hypothetical protein